jgi:hypothetical protein
MSLTSEQIDALMTGETEDSQTEKETEQQEIQETETVVDEKTETVETAETAETAEKTEQTEEVTDVDLALEVLDATEQETKVDPKDAVIGDFRRQLREKEQQLRELQSQRETTQAQAQMSPLELAAAKQECSVDEVVIDGKLYREQQAFERQQEQRAAQQQELQVFEESSRLAYATMTDAVMGKGLGLDSLAQMGGHLLTDGDKMDIIKAGKNCGNEIHDRLKYRILQAGGTSADILRANLANARRTHTKAKPEKKQQEAVRKKPASEEVEDEPGMRASTESIMADLGF